jgi:thioredoxin 1
LTWGSRRRQITVGAKQRALLFVVLLVVLGVVMAKVLVKGRPAEVAATAPAPPSAGSATQLPRMLELGSTTCKPCKEMEPIIAALKQELRGQVAIQFVDVYANPDYVEKYQVKVIPLQVFLDTGGKELFRHTGVYPKDEVLAKLRELGMLKG